jgi:hypothetical protein
MDTTASHETAELSIFETDVVPGPAWKMKKNGMTERSQRNDA